MGQSKGYFGQGLINWKLQHKADAQTVLEVGFTQLYAVL